MFYIALGVMVFAAAIQSLPIFFPAMFFAFIFAWTTARKIDP